MSVQYVGRRSCCGQGLRWKNLKKEMSSVVVQKLKLNLLIYDFSFLRKGVWLNFLDKEFIQDGKFACVTFLSEFCVNDLCLYILKLSLEQIPHFHTCIHVLLFSEEKDKSQLASGDALVEELDNSLFDKEYQLDSQVLKTEVGI